MGYLRKSIGISVLLAAGFGVLLTGCVSGSPKPISKEAPPKQQHGDPNDTGGADGVGINERDVLRF
ncbi:hypothetical protein SAMN05216420_104246 [Nitrosospira sp. Nl5]|uniref:hypothetical protein n=1 Tax=Nitrosospira sp. Nl5 TaxID=200120 RepID=UPI0008809203|nr:hypothetical protein [Nitrosospira sp. Nl5]SCY32413.1 hypothetical protein SAMN05216420_104246 [Nitrosospira sp. Nl5]